MGLPNSNSPWPPPHDQARYDRMKTLSAWYAGDPDQLSNLYWDGVSGAAEQLGLVKQVFSSVKRWFWGTGPTVGERNNKLHIDLAKDIATISSEQLFSDPPKVKVQGRMQTVTKPDGTTVQQPDEATVRAQERLDELLDATNWESVLLAAAETGAALGQSGLRVSWDKEIDPKRPSITRVDADAMIPEYRWGKLVAVTFWQQYVDRGNIYYRHLERHETGRVYHGLYKGGIDNLGQLVPLTDHPATTFLADLVDDQSSIPVPDGYRTAAAIPNMLPDPLDRHNNAGRSDFTPGILSLFDAIDEIYSSLMRDIELAKGRLVVADYMLDDNGPGNGATFNSDRKIFSPLRMQPGEDGDAPITMVQFKIRVEEHIRAAEHLAAKAVKSAGYNPQTMGDENGGAAMTATETNSRNKRSMSTRDKKIRYWQNELEQLLEALLAVDAAEFGSGVEVFPVKLEWPEAVQPDLHMLAETVELMKRAEAASIKVRVETLHPDWDEGQIGDEVAALSNEQSTIDPTTFGFGGSTGDGSPVPGI